MLKFWSCRSLFYVGLKIALLNIEHLKNTKLYSIEFLRTQMMSDPQTEIEYEPSGEYSLRCFEGYDLISVLKNSIE